MLRAGIVGLPNVGKSTLFNAVTRTRKAEAANYPFCTIDPNVGIVTVPDARLDVLQRIAKTNVVIPAAIEFVDIAGLVKGASQGEGLGNKFLTHIREVDAIVQVVRCFEDRGRSSRLRRRRSGARHRGHQHRADARRPRIGEEAPRARRQGRQARRQGGGGGRCRAGEDRGRPRRRQARAHGRRSRPRNARCSIAFFLLTRQADDLRLQRQGIRSGRRRTRILTSRRCATTSKRTWPARRSSSARRSRAISSTSTRTKRQRFSSELGVEESGIGALIRATYHLLGLQTYFTAGEKEVRAWTIHAGDTAPKAAGVIHSDFERGFIKAETVAYDDLVQCGSVAAAREQGLYRMEGKEYVVADGDVMLFKFNV